jgi:hypothetical protein
MPLHVSGFTRPPSGGSAHMLYGVISCVGCVVTSGGCGGVPPQPARSQHTSYARNHTK